MTWHGRSRKTSGIPRAGSEMRARADWYADRLQNTRAALVRVSEIVTASRSDDLQEIRKALGEIAAVIEPVLESERNA